MNEFFNKIVVAKELLSGQAHVTPVMQSETLNKIVSAQVFLKCENFQRVGAFKFRGAYNAISQLTGAQQHNGIIAYSSGNYAQAVALVCQILGLKATIVMPNDVPAIKRKATEGYGANVVLFDPQQVTRKDVAAEVNGDGKLTLIKPFDNGHVITGQGTAALEFIEQVGELDMMLAPCGGGGLLSGTAAATKAMLLNCKVIGIEPEQADDATRSFNTGVLHSNTNPGTIADGTRTARSLSDLGGRSEAERDRGHFFDHLRRIVSLFYENDREKAPISCCRSRFFLSPTGS
ncbi:MAG: threonine dehydratase [Candidatus Endobugula sp.]